MGVVLIVLVVLGLWTAVKAASALRDLKALCEGKGFVEGNTSTPGQFVIERAFVES